MTDLSLRNRLLLWIMPLVVTGFLAVGAGAYWYITSIIREELSRSMLDSVAKSAESINLWLRTIMIEPESIAATPAAKNINTDFAPLDRLNINRHIFLRKKYSDIFLDIYAANSRGEYHTVQEKDGRYELFVGDIANRSYFQVIMGGGPSQITVPLISRTTGVPTIFLVSPIISNDQPVGLVGAGISLTSIQKIVKDLNARYSGYAFLLAQDGTYVFHPRKEYILHNSISELEDPTARELGTKMLSGESGIFRFLENGVQMVAFYHPIPVAEWSVAIAVPARDLFAPASRMMRVLFLLAALFVIAISMVMFGATAKLMRPLQRLAQRVQEIARGNLGGEQIQVAYCDEIGRVTEAFNVMTANLSEMMATLKESEDRYRGIFENSLDGIFQSSLDGKILNANPAGLRMLGLVDGVDLSLEYQNIQKELYADPHDRERFLQVIKEKGEVRNFETQFCRKDGELIWVSINAILIARTERTIEHIEGIISDITSKKKHEEERTSLQQQLIQAQKMQFVGRLTGGVAHDFNNMLGAILGYTEMAMVHTVPDSLVFGYLREIKNATTRSADLTKQLLAFARKQKVDPQVLDVNAMVDGMLKMLQRLIGEHIELVWRPVPEALYIKIDPSQIDQLLANLCVNARDAITDVGKIIIETRKVILDGASSLAFQKCLPGEYVMLAVSDSGCGMSKDVLDKLFEPFFTTKEPGQGTGLGLATVYGIVRQNEGGINVYSEPGQGTVFKIYLPLQRGQIDPVLSKPEEIRVPQGHETILLVEDEEVILEITGLLLERLGYQILSARLPSESLELAQTYPGNIDLLITDMIMPEMNGRELAEKMTLYRPGIRCLFSSGYTGDMIDHHGILEEDIHFIQKPFSQLSLAEKVRQVLDA